MTYETDLATEEKVVSLFQPDTLLPAQYFETLRRKTLEPEKELMLAVLEDGVASFLKYLHAENRTGNTLFRNAEEWIWEENSEWPFSFENICDVVGIDPQYLRQGLMRSKGLALVRRPKAKIYRLTPGKKKDKSGVGMTSPTTQRMLKAVGR